MQKRARTHCPVAARQRHSNGRNRSSIRCWQQAHSQCWRGSFATVPLLITEPSTTRKQGEWLPCPSTRGCGEIAAAQPACAKQGREQVKVRYLSNRGRRIVRYPNFRADHGDQLYQFQIVKFTTMTPTAKPQNAALQSALRAARENEKRWREMQAEFSTDSEAWSSGQQRPNSGASKSNGLRPSWLRLKEHSSSDWRRAFVAGLPPSLNDRPRPPRWNGKIQDISHGRCMVGTY